MHFTQQNVAYVTICQVTLTQPEIAGLSRMFTPTLCGAFVN